MKGMFKTRFGLRLLCVVMTFMLLFTMSAYAENYSFGSRGNVVKSFQFKLFALGYLTNYKEGEFDRNTERAVEYFQRDYGLAKTGIVNSATLDEIEHVYEFSTDNFLLIVHGQCETRLRSDGSLRFRHQITNLDDSEVYSMIKFAYYCEDSYGNRVCPESGYVYVLENNKRIQANRCIYTDYVHFPFGSDIAKVYVAISEARTSDGYLYNLDGSEMTYIIYNVNP